MLIITQGKARFFLSLGIAAGWLNGTPSSAGLNLSGPAKLFASDGTSNDKFGFSVAVSRNTAVVSTFRAMDSVPGDSDSGSVYAFGRNQAGHWNESIELTQSDAPLGNGFGRSIAISGNRIIVAASADEQAGRYAGAAYIFENDGSGNWQQVAKLFASDAPASRGFGWSVDIDQDRAIIAAESAAYLFRRVDGGDWIEVAEVHPDDDHAYFGNSVAISGNTAVVGNPGGGHPGTAYVFREDPAGNWNRIAILDANDGASYNGFGESVDISDNKIIVSGETPPNPETRRRNTAAYIFEEDGTGTWEKVFSFVADAPTDEDADKAVAISGKLAVIGLPRDDLENPQHALLDYGSAYVFYRTGNSWMQLGHVQPIQLDREQYFGVAVAVEADTVLIGAYGGTGVATNTGAAYLYTVVPEPSTILLSAVLIAAFAFARKRRI